LDYLLQSLVRAVFESRLAYEPNRNINSAWGRIWVIFSVISISSVCFCFGKWANDFFMRGIIALRGGGYN